MAMARAANAAGAFKLLFVRPRRAIHVRQAVMDVSGCYLLWFHGRVAPKKSRVTEGVSALIVLAVLFWFLPTASAVKVLLFAASFGFLIAFTAVIALRPIYETTRGTVGAIAVLAIPVLL